MSTTKQTLLLYWRHAWRYPRYVAGLGIMLPLTLLVHQFLPPLIAANVLDRLSTGDFSDSGNVWQSFGSDLISYLLLVLIGGTILWRVVIFLVWKLEGYVLRDLARTQFNHLMVLSAKFHSNSFGGSLVSQTNKLNGSYVRLADTVIFQVYTMIIAFVYTIVIMWPRSPLFVLILLGFSAIFIFSAIKITKVVRDLVADEASAQNKQTGVLADAITNIMAVKSFSATPQEKLRFEDATEHTRKRTMRVMRASLVRDFYFGSVTSLIDGMALIVATISVVTFDAQIGTVFLLLSYTANITQRLWEFSQNTLRNFNRSLGDAKDGVATLNIGLEVKDRAHPEVCKIKNGEIEFSKVAFTHNNQSQNDALFKDLSLKIKPGEKIGLVGHSGSGKTTLTKLLLRFSDIQSGEILIDKQNIANITQDDLRKNIAYVPQEPLLFHRSITENIQYGNNEADYNAVLKAAKQANAHDFIKTLSDGYNTLVGERGVKLSGGQRQRIAIARALIKDAPILVLDEATSALDSESEQLIQDALWTLMQDKTAIVIAHRLSTIQKMDRIIVMEDGKIIEQGSHNDLLKSKGKYAELWAHQSGGFLEG